MNEKDRKEIEDRLSVLKGEELGYIRRFAATCSLGFGENVEVLAISRDSDGKIMRNPDGSFVEIPRMVENYSLLIQSSFRFSLNAYIILAQGDLFIPSSSELLKEDFSYDTFDYDNYGANRYDENVEQLLNNKKEKYVVEDIQVNDIGDIKIMFNNNLMLEILVVFSNDAEVLRFCDLKNENSSYLVTNKDGIIRF